MLMRWTQGFVLRGRNNAETPTVAPTNRIAAMMRAFMLHHVQAHVGVELFDHGPP